MGGNCASGGAVCGAVYGAVCFFPTIFLKKRIISHSNIKLTNIKFIFGMENIILNKLLKTKTINFISSNNFKEFLTLNYLKELILNEINYSNKRINLNELQVNSSFSFFLLSSFSSFFLLFISSPPLYFFFLTFNVSFLQFFSSFLFN